MFRTTKKSRNVSGDSFIFFFVFYCFLTALGGLEGSRGIAKTIRRHPDQLWADLVLQNIKKTFFYIFGTSRYQIRPSCFFLLSPVYPEHLFHVRCQYSQITFLRICILYICIYIFFVSKHLQCSEDLFRQYFRQHLISAFPTTRFSLFRFSNKILSSLKITYQQHDFLFYK